jgi:L-Ala-D/L-Glu epimerase
LSTPSDEGFARIMLRGSTTLKTAVGARDGLDVERVRAVRSVTDLPLQVDVNEYWEPEEALENVHALAELGVQYVEQPLPAGHPEG